MEVTAIDPTDAHLVARVLDGERDLYASLVERHQTGIYRLARGMGIDHDTSLDLVQDAFVRAYVRLEDCRQGESFRSWLFRICRNRVLDHLKNVRRLSIPLSVVEHAHQIEDGRSSDLVMDLTLRAALQRLPDTMREAFLLKHDAGYSYDEIADMTDSSTSAVKMRVHRARETLREFLIQQGVHAA